MSESKAPLASDIRSAEIADAVSARSKSIQTEWTHQVHLVRKQEFAYLRSVIKREGSDAAGQTLAGVPVRASATGRVRGDTLKKIDEIEAQLDLLWMSTRSKLVPSGFGAGSSFSVLALSQASALKTAPLFSAIPDSAQRPTQIMRHCEMPSSALLIPAVETPAATPAAPSAALGKNLHAPPVQQANVQALNEATVAAAATLFARADYAPAAQLLLRALRVSGDRTVQLQQVLALLEIYRATGNQAQFDWSVLEYFDCWDGDTPQWHTSPKARTSVGLNGQAKTAENTRFAPSGLDDARVWRCPSVLNTAAARKLRTHWLASRHCGVDWTSLSTLDATASAELVACFTQAQGAPSQLIFVDTPNLLCVLEQATPQGQPQVARSLWELRFCLLELMQMRAAFDAAATDFCLTYIEPAPTWKTSKIHFIGDARTPAPLPAKAIQGSPWHLSGHVLGATGLGLPDLPEHPAPQRITVACAALVRMDAEAIAQLLAWLRSASEKKADVHLQGVGVLVGAAWAAAGIDALAQVHLRDLG